MHSGRLLCCIMKLKIKENQKEKKNRNCCPSELMERKVHYIIRNGTIYTYVYRNGIYIHIYIYMYIQSHSLYTVFTRYAAGIANQVSKCWIPCCDSNYTAWPNVSIIRGTVGAMII